MSTGGWVQDQGVEADRKNSGRGRGGGRGQGRGQGRGRGWWTGRGRGAERGRGSYRGRGSNKGAFNSQPPPEEYVGQYSYESSHILPSQPQGPMSMPQQSNAQPPMLVNVQVIHPSSSAPSSLSYHQPPQTPNAPNSYPQYQPISSPNAYCPSQTSSHNTSGNSPTSTNSRARQKRGRGSMRSPNNNEPGQQSRPENEDNRPNGSSSQNSRSEQQNRSERGGRGQASRTAREQIGSNLSEDPPPSYEEADENPPSYEDALAQKFGWDDKRSQSNEKQSKFSGLERSSKSQPVPTDDGQQKGNQKKKKRRKKRGQKPFDNSRPETETASQTGTGTDNLYSSEHAGTSATSRGQGHLGKNKNNLRGGHSSQGCMQQKGTASSKEMTTWVSNLTLSDDESDNDTFSTGRADDFSFSSGQSQRTLQRSTYVLEEDVEEIDLTSGTSIYYSKNFEHNKRTLRALRRGDLVEFSRGIYSHWGVYIGNEEIIHLAGEDNDGVDAQLNRQELSISGQYDGAKVRRGLFWKIVGEDQATKNNGKDKTWDPLDPNEIVCNATSRLGEAGYNVLFNNCEHFAKWCRYGISHSDQVENVVAGVVDIAGKAVDAISKWASDKNEERKEAWKQQQHSRMITMTPRGDPNREHNRATLRSLRKGDLVEFKRGIYSHWGVYVGYEHIIHLAGVGYERTYSTPRYGEGFTICGKIFDKARVSQDLFWDVVGMDKAVKNNEKWTDLSPDEIVNNAYSKLGEVGYNLIFKNCEDFAKWCRYGEEKSDQVSDALTGAAIVGVLALGGYALSKFLGGDKEEEKRQSSRRK